MIWNKNYFSFNMKGDVRYMIWEAAVCLVKTIYIGNCQTYSIDGFELSYFSLPISIFTQLVYIFAIKSMLAINNNQLLWYWIYTWRRRINIWYSMLQQVLIEKVEQRRISWYDNILTFLLCPFSIQSQINFNADLTIRSYEQ